MPITVSEVDLHLEFRFPIPKLLRLGGERVGLDLLHHPEVQEPPLLVSDRGQFPVPLLGSGDGGVLTIVGVLPKLRPKGLAKLVILDTETVEEGKHL